MIYLQYEVVFVKAQNIFFAPGSNQDYGKKTFVEMTGQGGRGLVTEFAGSVRGQGMGLLNHEKSVCFAIPCLEQGAVKTGAETGMLFE